MTLLDGAMGTELDARGVPTPEPGWSAHALETAPATVRAIHEDYVRAGAVVVRTNTFRTQPRIFPDQWRRLVRTAVDLAREARHSSASASASAARIAGSMAPVFDCYRPDLAPAPSIARAAHRVLAEALAEEKVDLLVCETFPHAGEAAIAVEQAANTGLETWAALTAGPDGSLMSPEAMERAARDCVSAGARAVLVCCTGANITLAYVDRLARIGVPFGAYANAGDPSEGLGWGAPDAAARYAAVARGWARAGASILGSCCGTTPAHTSALAQL